MKLGQQLRKMRKEAPGSAHLLVYVTGVDLDGAAFGYTTWEQGFAPAPTSSRSSRFGATAIDADDLLHQSGKWRKGKVTYLGSGSFNPPATSLTRSMLYLLVSSRGTWTPERSSSVGTHARSESCRELDVAVSEVSPEEW